MFEEAEEGETSEDEEGVLRVAALVGRILLLLEANEGEAVILPSDSGKHYLKRYLNIPSYSAKLLLSGNASIEISFSRSADKLLGTANVTF